MNTLLLILMGLLLLFLIVVSYIIASFGMSTFFGAPFVATKQKMMQEAFQKAGLRKGASVMDIGCGDGSVLCAAKAVGAGTVIGYEINPILARYARWRLRKSDALITRGNVFSSSLKRTDIVFLYLLPKTVDRLKTSLSEFPPHTLIISRGFPFSNVVPMRSFHIDGSHFYLYVARDLT